MPIKAGDFILLNYVCKVKESGEIVDTTLEAKAKEAKLHGEGDTYEPYFLVLGEESWSKRIPKGLHEGLVGQEVGNPVTLELSPDKGFGQRDPSKIKLTPLRRLTDRGINPAPGMHVELDGKVAHIRSVGAGRVQLDYNEPLAGKTLIYEATVEKLIETREDKIKAILHKSMRGVPLEKFIFKISEKELIVDIPEEAFFLEGLALDKSRVVTDLQKYVQEIEKISFVESFTKAKPAEPGKEEKEQQVQTAQAK